MLTPSRIPSAEFFLAGPLELTGAARILGGPAGFRYLKRGEYTLMIYLMRRLGRVVDLGDLVVACWPDPHLEPENPEAAIRSRILRLRIEMEAVGVSGDALRSVYGVGYCLEDPSRASAPATAAPWRHASRTDQAAAA